MSNQNETDLCTSTNEDSNEDDQDDEAGSLIDLLKSTPDVSDKEVDSVLLQNRKVTVRDSEVQVDTPKINTLSDLLKTDSALRSFTGINNFQILECIVEIVKKNLQLIQDHIV